MAYVLVLVVVAFAVYLISAPLRAARAERVSRRHGAADAVAELEAARDAKYLEIRDAELDLRTGKLSQADYDALDGALRAEAVEILHRLDRARAGAVPDGGALGRDERDRLAPEVGGRDERGGGDPAGGPPAGVERDGERVTSAP